MEPDIDPDMLIWEEFIREDFIMELASKESLICELLMIEELIMEEFINEPLIWEELKLDIWDIFIESAILVISSWYLWERSGGQSSLWVIPINSSCFYNNTTKIKYVS